MGVTRALVVVGGRGEARAAPVLGALKARSAYYRVFCVEKEPTLEMARAAVALLLEEKLDGVVGFGGGSAIDLGKAVAALGPNPGDVMDYLEVCLFV